MPGGRRRKEKPPRSAGAPSFRNKRAGFEPGSTGANSAPTIYQRQEIGVAQFPPGSLLASSSPRTGPDAGIGIAGAAGDPATHRAPGGLARLAIDLIMRC